LNEQQTTGERPKGTGRALGLSKRTISRGFNSLVVVSVVAFTVYLYQNGLLYVPSPRRYDLLLVSFVLLTIGQVLGTLSWWRVLRLDFEGIPWSAVLAGTALSNLGKYVPGKVWVVAGRAAYVAGVSGESLVRLATSSTRSQLVTVWVGITIGLVGALVIGSATTSVIIILGLSVTLFLVIVFGLLERSSFKIHGMFRPKTAPVKHLEIGRLVRVLPFFLPGPVFRMLGFYLLALSIVETAPWYLMFAFPLATAIGMAAVFAPGGIGVREAVLVAAMVDANVSLQDATTIAVTARVWAVAGDIALFGVGLFVDWRLRVKRT